MAREYKAALHELINGITEEEARRLLRMLRVFLNVSAEKQELVERFILRMETGHGPGKDRETDEEAVPMLDTVSRQYRRGYVAGVATTLEADAIIQERSAV